MQPGPKVALIDTDTAADGELFAHAFCERQLGPLIGKRSWAGPVGIAEHGPMLDGGSIYVAEFGHAGAFGHSMIEGRDPQLEHSVAQSMRRLPPHPAALPDRPAAPVKTESP